jgi:hypothetical protein
MKPTEPTEPTVGSKIEYEKYSIKNANMNDEIILNNL